MAWAEVGVKANLAAAQLKAYESVIEAGQQTFVEVGQALAKIREQRLFREAGFHSFDDYCRQRWGMGKSYASQLISAGEVGQEFTTVNNFEQARALRRVPAPQRAEVMERVERTGQPVTAAAITQAHQGSPERTEPCRHCPHHCP